MKNDPLDILKGTASELGFESVGVARAECPGTYREFERWIDAGMHAGMDYLAKRREERRHPESVLPGVRSILMLGVSYEKVLDSIDHPVKRLSGIAEYARGVDYHDWVRVRFKTLSAKHRELYPDEHCRGAVDTAPILERYFAEKAGLGFVGKNTMLIHPRFGSRFFLAAFLSTAFWEADRPAEQLPESSRENNPCENCRRCLDACPTGALVEPYVLDARRCLNYWTIEHRSSKDGPIPSEILERLGSRFFGCDTCQDVCPWNRNNPRPACGTLDPKTLDDETLRKFAAGSPLERKFTTF